MRNTAEIPLQFSVDLAPSGRGCCKKCGNPIEMFEPRFLRKVRSPWHDGLDTQMNHLVCCTKWVREPNEVHGLGMLAWKDLQRFCDQFDLNINSKLQNNTPLVEFRYTVNAVNVIRKKLLAEKLNANILTQVLTYNGYAETILSDKRVFTKPMLTHMVADGLLKGLPPFCPLCQQMSLVCLGDSYYCYGYAGPTIKCDYWGSFNPHNALNPPNGQMINPMDGDRNRATKHCLIPPTMANDQIWKSMATLLAQVNYDAQMRGMIPTWKSKVVSSAKQRPVRATALMKHDRLSVPRDRLMDGLLIYVLGDLEYVDPELLPAAVERYGGKYTTDVNVLYNPPQGWTGICLVNANLFLDRLRSTGKARSIAAAGALILREEFIPALTAKDTDHIKMMNDEEMKSVDDEELDKENDKVKGVRLKNEFPAGIQCRLATNLKHFRLGGARSFDVLPPITDSKTGEPVLVNLRKVKRASPLMRIDPDFPHQMKDMAEHNLGIYVDRHNVVYHASLSYVDISQNKNSFYIIQLVEVSRVRKELIGRKRGAGGRKTANKKGLGTEQGIGIAMVEGSEEEDELLLRLPGDFEDKLYYDDFVDFASLSDANYDRLIANKVAKYFLFRKWGRVGCDDKTTNGNMVEEFGTNLTDCIKAFETKFHSMTGLDWREWNCGSPAAVPGKYQVIKLAGRDEDQCKPGDAEVILENCPTDSEDHPYAKSTLAKLMLSDRMQTSNITLKSNTSEDQIKVDCQRLDLNNLSENHLLESYTTLRLLETNILRANEMRQGKGHQQDSLEMQKCKMVMKSLSSLYYSQIPHVFSTKQSAQSLVIDNLGTLREECALLDSLLHTSQSMKIMKSCKNSRSAALRTMNYQIREALSVDDPEYCIIKKYVANGHGPTHGAMMIGVNAVYRLEQVRETVPPVFEGEPLLLWHGTRLTNLCSIFTYGLTIAPAEAPKTGYMFDKGLYFTDTCSKAAQYCYDDCEQPWSNQHVLLLYEVNLGKTMELFQADETVRSRLGDFTSVKGVGAVQPDPSLVEYVDFGIKVAVPLGGPVKRKGRPKSALMYNEYVVYDPHRIQPRYAVIIDISYKSVATK